MTKRIDGRVHEPYENVEYQHPRGVRRGTDRVPVGHLAQMLDMRYGENGYVNMEYRIPTRGLIGFNAFFLRTTRGDGVKNSSFASYEPMQGEIKTQRGGALVASEGGPAVTYGLLNAQRRGDTFIEPGTPVYEGMVVGSRRQEGDLEVNVCREKKLTNMRSSTADVAERLNATLRMSPGRNPGVHLRRRVGGGHPAEPAHPQDAALRPRPQAATPGRDQVAELATAENLSPCATPFLIRHCERSAAISPARRGWVADGRQRFNGIATNA